MKIGHITEILTNLDLPALDREQLLRLANSEEGRRFKDALLAAEAGDYGQRTTLERIISRIVAPTGALPSQRNNADQALQEKKAAPYYSFHVYGTAAALCISEASTRSTGTKTIQIEAAGALSGAGRKSFDWPNKIIVQLNEQELLETLVLFQGKISAVSFEAHGLTHDKFVRMKRQEKSFFVEVGQKDRSLCGVQVFAPDAFRITSLAYRQIQANAPHLDSATIAAMVDQVASMHREPPSRRSTR